MSFLSTLKGLPISLLLSTLALYTTSLPVNALELTPGNFKTVTATGLWFIEHFSPFCPHCRHFAPTWDQLIADVETDIPTVHLAQVNCAVYGDLCDENGIQGYPSLIMFEEGKQVGEYTGSREIDDLKSFIKRYVRQPEVSNPTTAVEPESPIPTPAETPPKLNIDGEVLVLNSQSFASTLEQGPTFVKFFTPWCGHCRKFAPTWEELAHRLKNRVNVAEVNCDDEGEFCREQGISGYPTLIYYANDIKAEYKRSRKLDQLEAFAEKASGSGLQTLTSADELDRHLTEEEVAYVLINPKADTIVMNIVKEAAVSLLGSPVVYVSTSPELLHRYSLPPNSDWVVVALKDHDARSPVAIYESSRFPDSSKSLKPWLLSHSLPTSLELTQDTFQSVMHATHAPLVVLAAVIPENKGKAEERLRDLARMWRARTAGRSEHDVIFAWMDIERWPVWMKNMYGIKLDETKTSLDDASVVITNHQELIYYDVDRAGVPLSLVASSRIFSSIEDAMSGHLHYKHSETKVERLARYMNTKMMKGEEYVMAHPLRSVLFFLSGVVFMFWVVYRLVAHNESHTSRSNKPSRLD